MINDNLKNIENYNFPSEVISFIQSLSPNVKLGKVVLSDSVYVNVEKYNTKSLDIAKFESHKKYIDIQILLSGKEIIYFTNVNNLKENPLYNENKDIMFYNRKVDSNFSNVILDGSNFAVFYPNDAHAPQIGNGNEVLKVVVKIKVSS